MLARFGPQAFWFMAALCACAWPLAWIAPWGWLRLIRQAQWQTSRPYRLLYVAQVLLSVAVGVWLTGLFFGAVHAIALGFGITMLGITLDYPVLRVQIDRERAGQLGVTVNQVGRSLVAATSSSRFVTPNYWADPRTGIAFQVQVQVPQPRMTSLEDLRAVAKIVDGKKISGVPLNNFGNQDYGVISLTEALTNSVNTVWAEVGEGAEGVAAGSS